MILKLLSHLSIRSLGLVPALALSLGAGTGALVVGGVVVAQTQTPPAIAWDARRLERLDRNVRRLDRALTQRNAAGDPVIIEPDPEVIALMGRVDLMDQRLSDLEATLVRINRDNERLTTELEGAERTQRDLAGRVDALTRRIAEMDSAAAEAQTGPTALTPRSPSGSEGGDFDAAMRLIRDGQAADAAEAFELFIVTWPESNRLPEAHYRLADLRLAAGHAAEAVPDYARALRGWPTTPWAADATVKLATALADSERSEQACQALDEFARRYAERAAPPVRNNAAQIARRAECS